MASPNPPFLLDRMVQAAILVMVFGAVIAGATDLTFSLPGYIWVAICAVSTAIYLLLIRLLKDTTGVQRSSVPGLGSAAVSWLLCPRGTA